MIEQAPALQRLLAALPPVIRSRRDVERNNLAVTRIHEDTTSWVLDEDRGLTRRLAQIDNDLAARNMLFSGARHIARLDAKGEQLHRWRDRKRAAERAIEDLRVSEGIFHRFWRYRVFPRRFRRGAWPVNGRTDEIAAALARWREPEIGGNGEELPVEEPL